MCDAAHHIFPGPYNQFITEMSTSIHDQFSWGAEPCKYVAVKELSHHTSFISACRYCFYPFRVVVHYKQDIQVTACAHGWLNLLRNVPHSLAFITSRYK